MTRSDAQYDLLLLGGGLANGLLAYYLQQFRPEIRWAIIEKNPTLGGHHTWSFHSTDVSPSSLRWLTPLISKSWPSHEVLFRSFTRTLPSGYHSIRSHRFHAFLTANFRPAQLYLNETIQSVDGNTVRLSSGTQLKGQILLDGRGLKNITKSNVGYQKFLGLDVELASPHGLTQPVLMDATCEQKDGFRFIYILPWNETSCLIEDTRYSNTADVNVEEYREEIRQYASFRGWKILNETHEEVAALPIPLRREFQSGNFFGNAIGNAGAFFHPTTGYSLPDAVRVIESLAQLPTFTAEAVTKSLSDYKKSKHRQWNFLLGLNRMLFWGAEPQARYRILERFYTLPESTIARFYALELSSADMARILIGKPPVSIRAAINSWMGRSVHA